jgi:PleD family two-component response regulator
MLEETIDRLTLTFRGEAITTGASIGVAMLGPHTDAASALEQADCEMYVRKAQQRCH